MTNLATIMFSYRHLLRLTLASSGMDSGLFVLPFGWKIFPYIYHAIGLVASGYLRACGIPCSLYIDDRLNAWGTSHMSGTLVGFARKQRPGIQIQSSYRSCLLCYVGIAKSVLYATTSVEYLGLTVDSLKQAFIVPRQN